MSENVLLYSPSGSGGSTQIEFIKEGSFSKSWGNLNSNTIFTDSYDTEKYIGVIVTCDVNATLTYGSGGTTNGTAKLSGSCTGSKSYTVSVTGDGVQLHGIGGSFTGSVSVTLACFQQCKAVGTYRIYGIIGTFE